MMMIYEGQSLNAKLLDGGIAELVFDAKGSVNKFDRQTVAELEQATRAIGANDQVKGVLVRSAKPTFIVGADITEFTELFEMPEQDVLSWVAKTSQVFNLFEDLPVPSIAAVNGFALGGGCEMTLACDFRVADTTAVLGLPEVKLGVMPGFGGTVRLPRLIGADNALEWMTTGKDCKADKALKVGAVDAVVTAENLFEAALSVLKDAIAGDFDWQARRKEKNSALQLNANEALMSFSTCKAMVFAKAGKHYPAPMAAVKAIEEAAHCDRAGAMLIENQVFAQLAKTEAATAQVGLFLADQVLKSTAKAASKQINNPVRQAAVLGAGIMGGGIAYQSAYSNIPIQMKDINQDALAVGLEYKGFDNIILNIIHVDFAHGASETDYSVNWAISKNASLEMIYHDMKDFENGIKTLNEIIELTEDKKDRRSQYFLKRAKTLSQEWKKNLSKKK